MKKVIVVYLICIIGMFFLPVFLVKKYDVVQNEAIDYNTKIKLLITEKNEVIDISLDEYIMGVLVGEMPVSYNLEALKAQAVVARTYTLNKIKNSKDTKESSHENADMCDDINHCQAYKTKEYALNCWDDNEENEKWNKIKTAVLETKNEVITHNGELINAFFHANSGGNTEDIVNIWGHENIPYLKSVEGNEENELLDNVNLTCEQINKIMIEKYPEYIKIEDEQLKSKESAANSGDLYKNVIKIIEKNSSGRVSKIQISNIILDGTEARSLFGLRSTFFEIKFTNAEFCFETKGYGHGIGLSQDGANNMASKGKTYQEIIKHFYTGVEIENMKF